MGPRAPSIDELDAMFGVPSAPVAPSAAAVHGPRGHDDDPLKARLRAAFLADLPARLADLDESIAHGDSDGAARLFHGMKGSAAYLDEPELRDLCGELEERADRAAWEEIALRIPRLRLLLAATAGMDGMAQAD
jgi:HPt (histidine-containing phosphotransfer) domain-containing protein